MAAAPRSPSGSGPGLNAWGGWLLVAASLGLLGWFWWQDAPSKKAPARKPKPPVQSVAPPKKVSKPIVPGVTNALQRPVIPKTDPPEMPTSPATITTTPLPPIRQPQDNTTFLPRLPQNIFEVQLSLARHGLSPGSIDGVAGSQTRAALRAFQAREGLPVTGSTNLATLSRLQLLEEPMTVYGVTTNDLNRLRPLAQTWFGRSQQDRLDYETVLECVAEKFGAHPQFLRNLNRGIVWESITPGTVVKVPKFLGATPTERAAFVKIFLSGRFLEVYGARSNLLAHFPCSIAERMDKRPLGRLEVMDLIERPNYVFDPVNFPTSPEARLGRLVLPAGPNNPVGSVWVALSRSGYGIHGTPKPEEVGRTGSLGCFRLANWNAEHLLKLAWVGMPVYVEPLTGNLVSL